LLGKSIAIAVTGSCTLEIPSTTPANLKNYTVIVPRDCPFDEIITELAPYNTDNILIYNTDPDQSIVIPAREAYDVLNVASISYEDGRYLVDTLATGAKITLEYNWFPGVGVANKNNAGLLSDSTSWGPDYEGGLWPHVVAPGETFFTTTHHIHYSYVNRGGTAAAQVCQFDQAYLT
jgi:hypothetical protein